MTKKWLHTVDLDVRDSDLDFMGGVSNARYLEYFSHGSNRMIKMLDYDIQELHARGYDCVIVRVEADYKLPLVMGDKIRICSDLEFKGTLRTIFNQQIVRLSDGAVAAEAKYIGCVLHIKDGEIVEPQELRTALENYLAKSQ